ncbi:MAG TPA: aminopeptidase [Wolbachia sp.]|uniref:M24 family metallopeptidase n=1 Tax=Wolbachia endosymbiont of Pentalonia nigronervosa TaxID=1301914 RepID=UPI000ECDDA5E|nr:M24 family metallopeptidase [Wolbachia endosymbiont of Pentalonia nigronervosa]MBD0391846.1 M24 family metallopeptidase [Wolbachia endosymbiont of Pentalonia nigronervosa]HCE59829.1 aminopeptidase [Wolbachia sp.]
MSKIEEFRSFMREIGVDAFMLHTRDEYLCEYSECLKQLCGFTGTNGLLIITQYNKCPFFTDGRYITQAHSQLDHKDFEIYNIQEKDPCEWVEEKLTSTITLSYYSQYFTIKELKKYEHICKLVPYTDKRKSSYPEQKIVLHPIEYSGESSKSKCERIAKTINNRPLSKPIYGKKFLGEVQESTAEYLDVFEECSSASTTKLPSEIEFRKRSNEAVLLTDINSISWLLNIRNENAKYTPHVLCRAILYENGKVDLFIQGDKLEVELDNHINIFNISELENVLHKLNSIVIDPSTTPMNIVDLLKNKQIIEREDPCLLSKAIKNQTEIAGAVNAHIQDAIAVTDFLYWLENNVGNGITELDAEKKILEYRKERDLFKQPSFPTISAFNENAAIIHYHASSSTNKVIQGNGLYLIDSGGQYLNGTTDVTRTVAIGTPTKEQITYYTIVLKAHIAIASAVFPQGTTGGELDILVRAHLWKFGVDYMHGTGHGVGSYLSVHEGPQAISKGNKVELVPGMIVSNEPGYYIPNKYGIRIENLMYVNKQENGFLSFSQLTCVPYDQRLIDIQMLTNDEIEWVNNYHKFVYKNLY